MHRPQASSRAGSSTQRPALSIRLRQAPVRACASFKNRNAIPARPFSVRSGPGSRVVTTSTRAASSVQ